MSSKRIISQFWVGTFDNEDRFYDFFGEDEEYFSEENEDNDDYPLSKFAASQNDRWYDHDFFETGFSNDHASPLADRFRAHSWAAQWGPIVEARMAELGLRSINAFAMMIVDQPKGASPRRQIAEPQSYSGEGVSLTYLGEITHEP